MIWSTEKIENLIKQWDITGVLPKDNPFKEKDIEILKPNLNFEYTDEELLEHAKIASDVLYFGQTYAKVMTDEGIRVVKLRPYQKNILKQLEFYRHNCILASRQCGKSLVGTTRIQIAKTNQNTTVYEIYSKRKKSNYKFFKKYINRLLSRLEEYYCKLD